MMFLLLVLLVLLALGGAGWGYNRYGVAGGIGPFSLVLVLMVVLFWTGYLHV